MAKCIRLTAEAAPPKPTHALLDVVTINLATGKVQPRGAVGHYVDGPEGGKVLVPHKVRDDELDVTPEDEAYVLAVLQRLAGRDKFKGTVEDAPAVAEIPE